MPPLTFTFHYEYAGVKYQEQVIAPTEGHQERKIHIHTARKKQRAKSLAQPMRWRARRYKSPDIGMRMGMAMTEQATGQELSLLLRQTKFRQVSGSGPALSMWRATALRDMAGGWHDISTLFSISRFTSLDWTGIESDDGRAERPLNVCDSSRERQMRLLMSIPRIHR